MAASRLQCGECGTQFYARADALYCSNSCRQKAHRTRAVQRAVEQTVAGPKLDDAINRARQTCQLARTLRERAEAARQAASQGRAHEGVLPAT